MAGSLLFSAFFLSGASGLLYQVVWLRMLARTFGVSAYATSNVVGVFMLGLALGAGAAARRCRDVRDPLKAYAVVELALALLGVAASVAAARLPELLAPCLPSGPPGSPAVAALRTLASCAVLLPPTVLMGASLPLLAERLARRQAAVDGDGVGLLYGVNTLGAVAGVLLAGFYAIDAWGETATWSLAAALNAAAAAAAWLAADGPVAAPEAAPKAPPRRERAPPPLERWILPLSAVTGFCALGLEVVWTRLLILLLGTSVYAFASMLAVYLAGIGAGSLLSARALRRDLDAERAFVALQAAAGFLVAAAVALYGALGGSRSDPVYLYSPIQSWTDFASLFLLAGAILFPVTLVYGALFPLSARLAGRDGAAVGRLTQWNTLGSLAGALAAGFVLIPALGSRGALYAFAAAHLAVGAIGASACARGPGLAGPALGAALLAALACYRADPFLDILRARLQRHGEGRVSFHHEGASSTVTGYASARGENLLLINGIIVSGKGDLGRFMAHLPLLLREAPRRALIICLGAGNTFRAAVDHGVQVDLVELEPEVVDSFERFWPDHKDYLASPRAAVHVNDGRNFVLAARERYDALVFDGSPPIFSAGTVNLYSREFFDRARGRLTPGGVLALWVPLPCFESEFWMIARSFTDAFPFTAGWAQPGLPGVLLLGSGEPLDVSPAGVASRIAARKLQARDPWLNEGLLAPQRVVPDAALRTLASRFPPVTDDRPRTEFPLPRFRRGETLQKGPEFVLRHALSPAPTRTAGASSP